MMTSDEIVQELYAAVLDCYRRNVGKFIILVPEDFYPKFIGPHLEQTGKDMKRPMEVQQVGFQSLGMMSCSMQEKVCIILVFLGCNLGFFVACYLPLSYVCVEISALQARVLVWPWNLIVAVRKMN